MRRKLPRNVRWYRHNLDFLAGPDGIARGFDSPKPPRILYTMEVHGALAQLVGAVALQAVGQGFESPMLHPTHKAEPLVSIRALLLSWAQVRALALI